MSGQLRASGRRALLCSGILLSVAGGVGAVVAGVGTVRADGAVTTATTCVDKAMTTLSWAVPLTLPKFDPALGTLQSVHITGNSKVQGSITGENMDLQPADVNATVSAKVTLQVPDADPVVAAPTITKVIQNVPAFDGIDDRAGASGFDTGVLNTFADFAPVDLTGAAVTPYIGTDSWSSSLKASGNSTATGPSNLDWKFATSAAGQVCVLYSYVVPPTTTTTSTTTTSTTVLQSTTPTTPKPSTTPPAVLQLAPTTAATPNGQLPPTGRGTGTMFQLALLSLALGAGAIALAGVRRRPS